MKCSGCMKTLKDGKMIKCISSGCGKGFCSLCINIALITADQKKEWKCPECRAIQKRGGDNSHTPVRTETTNVNLRPRKDAAPTGSQGVQHEAQKLEIKGITTESLNLTLRPKKADIAAPGLQATQDETQKSELKILTATMARLTEEFTSLKTKLEEVWYSLTHCHERMDELVSTMAANNTRLINLEKRDAEVFNLKATVSHLQNELNSQAQYNLRNEVEIVGIPEIGNENLDHIVKVTMQKIGVQLQDSDIDWIARVGSRRPIPNPEAGCRLPRPVVVKLLRRSKRDNIIKAARSRKNLTSTDLEFSGNPSKIFFNERLTKENRRLFREARIRAKRQGYAYCWCHQGAILVKQREGTAALVIRSTKDLECIQPNAAENNSS